MSLSDLIFTPIKYLFLIPTIIILVALLASSGVLDSTSNLAGMFNDICSKGGISIMQGFNYDEQTALIQFVTPGGTSGEMEFNYPRNTFLVLSSVFDETNNNLYDATRLYAGLWNPRRSSNLLEQCINTPCFCAVRSEMNFLTFSGLEYTACFPRLYAYNRTGFDACIKEAYDNIDIESLSIDELDSLDSNLFVSCVNTIVSDMRTITGLEPSSIVSCYDYLDTITYSYSGEVGKYLLTLNNAEGTLQTNDSAAIKKAMSDFYNLTRAGLYSEVLRCVPIPVQNECLCPYIEGNQLVADAGVFIGVAGSKYEAHSLDITSLILRLDQTGSACNMSIEVG